MFSIEKAAGAYLNSVRASGCSPDTVENYRRAIDRFKNFVTEDDTISPAAVENYKVSLFQQGLKQSTIRAYIEALSLFFEWCAELGYIDATPCTSVVKKTKVPPLKAYSHLLDREATSLVLRPICPKGATRSVWPRTYAIVAVLITSGCRNSELRNLTLADLDFEHGILYIRHGKGDKERPCAFPPVAQNAVRNYLNSPLRPVGLTESDFLFGKGNDPAEWHQFARAELSTVVERYIKCCTGIEGIRTHALRHTSASILWDSGVTADEISSLLGHNSVSTTARYLDRLRPNSPAENATAVFGTL